MNLESVSDWTAGRVAQSLKAQGQGAVAAAAILDLSQRQHLNPGLLLAAMRDLPARTPEDLADSLRASLNASANSGNEQRLQKAVHDLGGPAAWVQKWKKEIQ